MAKAPSTFSDVTVLRYKKGEQIIKQGDYGISIYIILNGNVEVSRESEGGDVVLATLGPGDIIGEMIFLNKGVEVRSASARALQDSELEVWHPKNLVVFHAADLRRVEVCPCILLCTPTLPVRNSTRTSR